MGDDSTIQINSRLNIPVAEVEFRYSTSSGPGGQHVNRSATKVTLRFDVAGSPSLSEEQRERILRKLASRLGKEGVLLIRAQEHRSQRQNREAAVARFREVLADALRRPRRRRKTKPSKAAVEKRLREKRQRSERKRERSRKTEDGP
jgi:ribosome-associated protein